MFKVNNNGKRTTPIVMKMKVKIKNRPHIYDLNRTRSKHGYKYTKYKMCFIMIMVICNKQHLKADSRVEWRDSFQMFYSYFLLKKEN